MRQGIDERETQCETRVSRTPQTRWKPHPSTKGKKMTRIRRIAFIGLATMATLALTATTALAGWRIP